MKILMTGASGFLGSSLAGYIRGKYKSWVVHGIDKKRAGRNICTFDITNKDKLTALIGKIRPRYIFHFAGTTDQVDFRKSLLLNVYTTQVLLEVVRSIKKYKPRIFIPASAAEYGEIPSSGAPVEESCQLRPISLYGFSKAAQEHLALFYAFHGLDIVIGRIFNVVGKGAPAHLSIGNFARELALIKKKIKKPILHTKNLESRRDFLDINDICEYIIQLVRYGKKGEIYNICRGRPYRIGDLLDRLIKISGVEDLKIISDKKTRSNYDISNSFGSTKKLSTVFKLIPQPIDKSLRDTYFYYFNQ